MRTGRYVAVGLGMLLVATSVFAADAKRALAEIEGRRAAAENGAREIKSKAPGQVGQVRKLYTEAADRQNAWLSAVCQSIEAGAAAAPDVSGTAAAAADALVAWVSARNKILGAPELTGAVADGARISTVRYLTEVAESAWKSNHRDDASKRSKAAAALGSRLKWKNWDDVQ